MCVCGCGGVYCVKSFVLQYVYLKCNINKVWLIGWLIDWLFDVNNDENQEHNSIAKS